MDINKITNVLIFKDGYYWLTIHQNIPPGNKPDSYTEGVIFSDTYRIAPDHWGLKNGFEFASDAYAYIVSLQPPSPVVEYDKEEERLKERGEV